MLIRLFNNKIWLYLAVALGFALLQTLALRQLVTIPFGVLFIDSLVYAFLYFLISIPLLSVLRFGKLELLTLPLQIFNYFILAVITLGATLGIAFLIETLTIDKNLEPGFISLLPLRGLLSLVAYLFVIVLLHKKDQEEEIYEGKAVLNEKDIQPLEPETKKLERFAVKSGTKIHVVLVSEIICLIADGDYVQVITADGKFLKEQTMKYFENNLSDNQFVRVHRSCIVNVEAISRIELYEKQNQQLMLKNGHKVKVSQNGYKMLREKLKL
jgi:hypothetical protein